MPTGNTQQVINYGATPNDGTGDPLRTAFIKTDENFDNIWLAGPAGSNVRITNNTIGVLDTNGNLILSPNGIGVIQTNNHVVPRASRTYDLGSANLQYRTVYANSAAFQAVGVTGDLTVGGNLTVQGNIIQVGNIVTETLTIQLANAATTANAANGSGITVGANDNIATLLYNSASNVWTTNIGVSAVGNITAPYFIGNGRLLTGLAASYGNSNVANFLASYGSNTISTTGNISAGNVLTSAGVIASGVIQSGTGLSTGGYLSVDGTTDLHDTTVIGNLSVSVIKNDDSTVVKIEDGVEIDGDALVNGDVTADAFIGNGNLTLQPDPANPGSYLDIFLTSGPDLHLVASAAANLILGEDAGPNIMTSWDGNVYVQSWNQDTGTQGGVWTFGGDGGTIFPTLTVQRGDNPSGTIQGQTLLFGDTAQEAIISTADGTVSNENSQRLVINPGQGYDYGEGGDIYLWAGRGGNGSGSGGDIKIRGGQGGANTTGGVGGNGGYIRIEAGDSATTGGAPGYIDINGGVNYIGAGGYVDIRGGQGQTIGGDANITGGYGYDDRGGNVNIWGGGSANGQSNEGHVNIQTGGNTWTFDPLGNLTLPAGGSLYSEGFTPSGNPGNTIVLNPHGSGTFTNQKLMIYPTANDGDHVHMATGNLYETELFLGSDDFYVKLANTGNVVINSNDSTGNIAAWTFGADGNLTVPGNMAISGNTSVLGTQTALLQPNDGIPLSILTSGANGTVTSFWAEDIANIMTSNIAAIYTPLQGTNTVRIVTGSNSGNIAIYDFDKDGMFSTADISASGNITAGNIIMSGSIVGSGASPAPYLSGFSSVSAINVSASGNVTGTYVKGNGSELTNLPAPTVAQDITSVGNMSIMTYDGNLKYASYATVEPASGNIAGGNISTTGNITGGNILTDNYFYANGSPFVSSNYGNANVAANLAAFGSNPISTTGNITAGNFIGNGAALTNVTVSVAGNIVGTQSNVSLVAGSYTMTFDNTGLLTLPTMGGDEGGEINLGIPTSNTTLQNRVAIDVFQDRVRFFEGSANAKGAYIDLAQSSAGVGTLLNNRVSALVNAGTFVTMDLIKATVTTTGNRGLSLATTTGTFACNIGGTYSTTAPSNGGNAGTLTVTTTASGSVFNWGFPNQGDLATYVLTDTTNSRAYRITLQIGSGYNNNMISIERLI